MRQTAIAMVIVIIVCGQPVSTAKANLVTNGELTGPIPATNGGDIPSVPPGWTAGHNSIAMHESGGVGFFGEQYPESPGGTQFVAGVGGSAYATLVDESFLQTINGLTPGNSYELIFYQANLGVDTTSPDWMYESAGYWQVSFGSSVFDSPVMPFLGFGADSFSQVSTIFVADSDSQVLEFTAKDGGVLGDNNLSYVGIDDISLTLVPEPSVLLLMGVGSAGLLIKRRR